LNKLPVTGRSVKNFEREKAAFVISIYAQGVPKARSLSLSPKGTLFVGTRESEKLYALRDEDRDFKAERVYTLASGLDMPNGVAVKGGSLFVAERSRIPRYDDVESRLGNPPEPAVVYDRFPTDRALGWKFIHFGPDGKLYVPIGAPCNVCLREDERYATITRINPDGSGFEIFARGMRFYLGDSFPEEYTNQIFIPGHGSWNRTSPIGYRVTLVRIKDGRALSCETFAGGWLQGKDARGRPVDIEHLPDRSLLVSDDKAGAIYRISYENGGN
jgi:glucose/arabinose dehydrogenase